MTGRQSDDANGGVAEVGFWDFSTLCDAQAESCRSAATGPTATSATRSAMSAGKGRADAIRTPLDCQDPTQKNYD
jgi:hypothetical protein